MDATQKAFKNSSFNTNEEKSAANFCHQVAAWVSYMFCNFHIVKNCKIANNLATTEGREKSAYVESLEFYKKFDACLTKLEIYQILLNKIIYRFLLTTKLFSGRKSLTVLHILYNKHWEPPFWRF